MTNEELDRWLAENVMGWKEGKPIPGPAYGGCAPIDAEIVIPDTKDHMRLVWGTRAIGGTYPFYYGGVVYSGGRTPGFSWLPTRRIEQAIMVLDKLIGDDTEGPTPQIYWSCGGWWCRLSGLGMAYGAKRPAEAICKAVKAAGEGGER